MTKPCSACVHPKRDSIDRQLLNGDSLRDIEATYGVSKSALQRHKAEHLSIALIKAASPAVIADNKPLVDQLRDIHARTLTILEDAEHNGDGRMGLLAIRECRSNLELIAKIEIIIAGRAVKGEITPVDLTDEEVERRAREILVKRDGAHQVIFVYPQLKEHPAAAQARLAEIIEARRAAGQATDLQAMDEVARKEFLEKLIGPVHKMVEPATGVQIYMPDNNRDAPVWRDELRKKIDRAAARQDSDSHIDDSPTKEGVSNGQ